MKKQISLWFVLLLSLSASLVLSGCKKKPPEKAVSLLWYRIHLKTRKWEGFRVDNQKFVAQLWSNFKRTEMNPMRKQPDSKKIPPRTQVITFLNKHNGTRLSLDVYGNRYIKIKDKYHTAKFLVVALSLLNTQGRLAIIPPDQVEAAGFKDQIAAPDTKPLIKNK